jgi:hypothetical protein
MQKTVSISTAEAEYYAAPEMAIEVPYLRNLLANMGLPRSPTRQCTKITRLGEPRDRWTRAGQAHLHPQALCARGDQEPL